MVHKNYKWNLSKEQGSVIVNDKIKEILCDSNNRMELSELNFAIQNRTKDIPVLNNHKKKTLINFIKIVLGGLRNFLENNKETYSISINGNNTFIQLNNFDDIYLNEWVIIDDDY
tara:strand:+ start:128 stop:472 length:345 start_codon:yes stop_codon:yes gene_type:complete